jgi:hypothetical protein
VLKIPETKTIPKSKKSEYVREILNWWWKLYKEHKWDGVDFLHIH